MTFSRLKYCRSLVEEGNKIQKVLVAEHRKQRRNKDKIEMLKQTQAEVCQNRSRVVSEVEAWIKETPTSKEFQMELTEFYVKGNKAWSQNFHREVECLFGENISYKKINHDKKMS